MTYQEQEEEKQKKYKAKLAIALEEFSNMRSKHLIRDEGVIENSKVCAKKHKVKFKDLLKTRIPGNNFTGQKSWDKNGTIYTIKK